MSVGLEKRHGFVHVVGPPPAGLDGLSVLASVGLLSALFLFSGVDSFSITAAF